MDKVIQNILDPNTKATAKRKITLTIELTPDDERRTIGVSATAKSTLAATNPVATALYVTSDGNGELVVAEMVPQVPGQMNMDGTQQEAPKLLKLVQHGYGLTIFPDDGSTPIVCISAEAPISAAPELLAHELAHVATPEDTEHGESWSTASEAIFKKYNELLDTMIPDEPEPVLSPHQPGDGGILTMPLRDNVPEPPTDDWQLTTCPVCGAECWQTDTARRILALEPDVRTACTACALKGLGK